MKKQTQKRAYNIYQNGKLLKVVGGTSAGRFYSTNTMSTKRPKNRTRGITVRKVVQAGCIGFLVLMWVLCSQANKPIVKVDQAQAVDLMSHGDESVPAEGSFESADMPKQPVTIEDKVSKVFGKDSDNALKIIKCESSFNPTALGDTNTRYPSAGLFQIRLLPERQITKEQMFDVDENIKYAKMLFDKYQWKPWSCKGVVK